MQSNLLRADISFYGFFSERQPFSGIFAIFSKKVADWLLLVHLEALLWGGKIFSIHLGCLEPVEIFLKSCD